MTKDSLLLVTNLSHDDRAEDLFLADVLSKTWDVTITSPMLANQILATGSIPRCLIRNAWPSRVFRADFQMLEAVAQNRRIEFYNPLGRARGPVEDKTYLSVLYRAGMSVIPTYLTAAEVAASGYNGAILCKPIDGCSSIGIIEAMSGSLPTVGRYIFQPKIEFAYEVSYFFIDNKFVYALASAGSRMDQRWQLSEFVPEAADISWAQQFVAWNKLPYGVQRIDAACLPNGDLLLMEVEDSMPFLSLLDLQEGSRKRVVKLLMESIWFALSPARPREKIVGRSIASELVL